MHSNARVIETLYSAIQAGDSSTAATCYANDAFFRDIAFTLNGRESIRQMWRLVCSRKVQVTFNEVTADAQSGSGHWVADYVFSETGNRVINDIRSHFTFKEGLIVAHHDSCNAMTWAKQAYCFPVYLIIGLIGPLRRWGARKKLERFIQQHPEARA